MLISGAGSNLQAFIDRRNADSLAFDIAVVVSNRRDAKGLRRATDADIPTVCIEHSGFAQRSDFDRAIASAMAPYEPDFLVLAGFMRILGPEFVARFPGRILNIHPALLPAYTGLDTHRRVLASGDAWHGATVHFVSDKLDGGPRILQGRVPIASGESPADLAKRVQRVEHQIYPLAAQWVADARAVCRDGATWFDGHKLSEPLCIDFDESGAATTLLAE